MTCSSIVKQHNKNIEGVDPCKQYIAAYRPDRKSKCHFYLRIFFDLMDVAIACSFIVYDKLCPDKFFFS